MPKHRPYGGKTRRAEKTYGKRQPRPVLRKQGTKKGAVHAARREAGV